MPSLRPWGSSTLSGSPRCSGIFGASRRRPRMSPAGRSPAPSAPSPTSTRASRRRSAPNSASTTPRSAPRCCSGTGTPPSWPPWPSWAGPWKRSPWRSATCSARRSGKRKSRSGPARRGLRPCPTSATRSSASRSAGWCGCSAPTPWSASRTRPCGTSGTFRTLPRSALSCPTVLRCSTTCCALSRSSFATCTSTRTRCWRTSAAPAE